MKTSSAIGSVDKAVTAVLIVRGLLVSMVLAFFAGLIPASNPRLAMMVLIDEPGAGAYYGGAVAAPVFAEVMGAAVRLLDIPPDDLPQDGPRIAASQGAKR